jgi:hypothetical protein
MGWATTFWAFFSKKLIWSPGLQSARKLWFVKEKWPKMQFYCLHRRLSCLPTWPGQKCAIRTKLFVLTDDKTNMPWQLQYAGTKMEVNGQSF